MIRYPKFLIQPMAVAFLAAGCGGGGGGEDNPPPASPPAATASDVARGAITGFGSIYLNGTRYDTDDATVHRSGGDATQGDLSVGMVVKIRGNLDDHHASRVEYDEDVKGPIDEILGNGLLVMGQVVVIEPTTHVDDSLNLGNAMVGNLVEVSGLRNGADEIVASFIEDKDPANINAYQVVGQVRALDSTARTFRIGGLTVDYSTARFDDFSTANLANNLLVEVKDENRAYNPGDLRLVATKVELESATRLEDDDDFGRSHDDDDSGEIEGLITRVIDPMHFVVAGVTVTISATTTYERGDATNLVVGAKVEVHGRLGSGDAMTAIEVEFSNNAARIAGIVENVDAAAGVLEILGVTIRPVAGARQRDNRDAVTPFDLFDVTAGDFVEARGVADETDLLAYELERDRNDDTRLRAAATDIDGTARTLRLLGVPIVTNAGTEYENVDDQPITATQFFQSLNDGQTLVDARWDDTVTDPAVAVKELSLED